MQVAIPLFDRLTALDAIVPYEVLSRLAGAEASASVAGAVLPRLRMLTRFSPAEPRLPDTGCLLR